MAPPPPVAETSAISASENTDGTLSPAMTIAVIAPTRMTTTSAITISPVLPLSVSPTLVLSEQVADALEVRFDHGLRLRLRRRVERFRPASERRWCGDAAGAQRGVVLRPGDELAGAVRDQLHAQLDYALHARVVVADEAGVSGVRRDERH